MACVQECHFGARYDIGKRMTADEVVDVVRRDQVFYRNSGGGMTLGEGKPILQYAFAAEILSRCRNLGINTALETCGFTREDRFDSVVKHVDLLLMILKTHGCRIPRLTGVDNALILKNAIRASRAVSVWKWVGYTHPRIQRRAREHRGNGIVHFYGDGECSDRLTSCLITHMGHLRQNELGRNTAMTTVSVPEELLTQVREILEGFGLTVSIGG